MPQERLRRGVGRIYVAAGLLNWGSLALLRLRLPVGLWKLVFFSQFLLLIVGSLLYLALSYARADSFDYHPLVDFLIGVALFVVLLTVSAAYAQRLFWLPGAFLIGYGLRLAYSAAEPSK